MYIIFLKSRMCHDAIINSIRMHNYAEDVTNEVWLFQMKFLSFTNSSTITLHVSFELKGTCTQFI